MIKEKIINRIPRQVTASFVILIATFITGAMSFITTPIFTRLMSVAEYGLVAQYNSWLEIITVIATLSLSSGVYQVAMNEFPQDRESYTFSSMILSNIVTTVVFLIIFLFQDFFINVFKLSFNLLVIMYLSLMFCPAYNMWLAKQRYEYEYKKVAVVSIFSIIFNLGVGVLAVSFIKGYNLGVVKVWATGLAQIVTSGFIYFIIAKKANFRYSVKYMKYAIGFNLPLLPHYLAQYVLRSSDKIMITNFCGEEATGIYSLGVTVASIAVMAWSAMAASLTPYMYSHINTKEYKKVNNAVIAVESIFGICCFFVALIGPEITYILGSKKYMVGIYLIPPIAASSLLTAIYGFYSTIAFYYHKRVSTAVMTIIAALINIGLNYILIPKYGYMAAAYTTETAYLIYTLLHYINYRRIVGTDLIFNDKIIWLITIITTFACLATGLLYRTFILRYTVAFSIMALAVIFRKKIVTTVKMLLTERK